jgi:hypothetical protein
VGQCFRKRSSSALLDIDPLDTQIQAVRKFIDEQ